MAEKGRTARYYATGTTIKGGKKKPAAAKRAKAVKAKLDKVINKAPKQLAKRRELGKRRTKAIKEGKNIKGKDYDHKQGKFIDSSVNRGQAEGSRLKGSKRKKK